MYEIGDELEIFVNVIPQESRSESLSGTITVTNGYSSCTIKPGGENACRLKLISSLSATLDKKSGLVTSLSYTDKSGNKVTYKFSGIKTNAAIPASVWNFNYPKEVQVIEQ